MRQRIQAIRANESGFTLIELLITVVILGVLAGVVVFAVGNFNNEGVTAACKADKKNVEVAAEAYFAKKSAYAIAMGDLVSGGYLREAPPALPATDKYGVSYTHVLADAAATPPIAEGFTVTATLKSGTAC